MKQAARTLVVAYSSRGNGKPVVPFSSKFAGAYDDSTWSVQLPRDGENVEDEIMHSIFSHKIGKQVGKHLFYINRAARWR